MKQKTGISLIVLVITIIIVIILAAAVILTINKNNPIDAAKEAVFKSNVDSFQNELSMYHNNNYVKLLGEYEPDKLKADSTKVEYTGAGQVDTQGKTIKDVITGTSSSTYSNEFEVINGKLAYKGTDSTKQQWALDSGILLDNDKTNVTISTKYILPIKQTGSIEYTIDVFSNLGIKDIGDITNSIKVIDKDNNPVTATITVGEIKSLTNEKQITVTVQGTGIADGNYRVKLLAGAVENNANLKNVDIISINSFTVDSTAPEKPEIATVPADISNWTNQNVQVTIAAKDSLDSLEYSFDGTNYQAYTAPITVSDNLTVYAKEIDKAENKSEVSTLTITRIDKVVPQNATISTSLSGAVITANVALQDNESEIDLTKSKYVVSQASTVYAVNDSVWNSASTISSNPQTINYTVKDSGNYYVQVLSVDKAGNMRSNISSNYISLDINNIVVSTVKTVNTTFSGATTEFTYSNPVIPAGFVAVDTDTTKWSNLSTDWNNGLVIQDSYGNQFVWVPVDGINVQYAKDFSYPSWHGSTSSNTLDDTLPSDFDTNKITNTYQGFYMARYEASNNGGKAGSKKASSWNYINYTDSKTYSENMDTSYGYDTTKVGTNLITGQEWDTTMKWIKNSGINVATDSTSWGNYYNSSFTYEYPTAGTKAVSTGILLNTGAASKNREKNIYDLAGNVGEWTNEKTSTSTFMARGGSYVFDGSQQPSTFRADDVASTNYDILGFRFALYVK